MHTQEHLLNLAKMGLVSAVDEYNIAVTWVIQDY